MTDIVEQLEIERGSTKLPKYLTCGVIADEIKRLHSDNERLKEWCRKLIEGGTFPGEADGLRLLNAELVAALEECATDLESELNGRYDKTLDYPSQKRRYDRDMEPVIKARAVLDKVKVGK